ncbi:uncharacterized protein [Aristolochia californica]|uniref:uncharacterized protein n=1 Tax=Aristolochia californica TaxID=171875 RepID=UPI0035E08925
MGNFYEEKALGDEPFASLEEKILSYFSGTLDTDRFVDHADEDDVEENDGRSTDDSSENSFWKDQESLLQEVLARGSSIESSLSRAVRQAKEMVTETGVCHCNTLNPNSCDGCLREAIIDHLRALGYDAAFCTSLWKASRDMPGGKHEFIDVVIHATERKKESRYVIEPEFRAEFEMAKACDHYRKLMLELPECYVGKPEHLSAMVRLICNAGKRSMRERKMHMGPWRKRKFMQMKWSGPYRRSFSGPSPVIRQRFPTEVKFSASTCDSSFCPTVTIAVI